MSENKRRRGVDYARIDAASTEELEEILRLDAENHTGDNSNIDTILYILEVLEKRKEKEYTGPSPEEAFKSFLNDYLPCEDDIGFDELAADFPLKVVKMPVRRWKRALTAVAAALAIVFLGTISANAFGYNVWEAIVSWTQETFRFTDGTDVDDPTPKDKLEYASLQELLLEKGITTPLAPTWIPERFELTEIRVDELPIRYYFLAVYGDGKNVLKIQIKSYDESDSEQVEQSDDFYKEYPAHNTIHYIFQDNNCLTAVWVRDGFECYISGELTVDELENMIDSIEKG